ADYPTSADFSIRHPFRGRYGTGIDPVDNRHWLAQPSQRFLQSNRQRREPAVEANHEERPLPGSGEALMKIPDRLEIVQAGRQRLFHENCLARLQSLDDIVGMGI